MIVTSRRTTSHEHQLRGFFAFWTATVVTDRGMRRTGYGWTRKAAIRIARTRARLDEKRLATSRTSHA